MNQELQALFAQFDETAAKLNARLDRIEAGIAAGQMMMQGLQKRIEDDAKQLKLELKWKGAA